MELKSKVKEFAGLNGFRFVYGTLQYANLAAVSVDSCLIQMDPVETEDVYSGGYLDYRREQTNIAMLVPSTDGADACALSPEQLYEFKYENYIKPLKERAKALAAFLARCGGFEIQAFRVLELSGVLDANTDGIMVQLTVRPYDEL